MAALLRNNIEAERRRAKDGSSSSAVGQSSQNRREVPDILSWIQCFGMYACVVAAQRPEKIHQLLAYQTMVVREARRWGGGGGGQAGKLMTSCFVSRWRMIPGRIGLS